MTSRPINKRHESAFSITELMVTMAILLIVVGIAMSCQMYGLRMFEIVKPKLSASDDARKTVASLIEDVREAQRIRIGAGGAASFVEIAPNFPQRGNAIQIQRSASTNAFTRYYWDSADQKVKRLTSDSPTPIPIAHSVSNEMIFTAEDFTGQVLTNNFNNRVIGLTMDFYQIQYPRTPVGPGNFYDFYRLRTKITRRTLL